MIASLIMTAICLQDQTNQQILMPPGISASVHNTVRLIEQASTKGDWKEATRLANRLPSLELSIEWDDAKVPVERRSTYKAALEEAVDQWQQTYKSFNVTFKKNGSLKFGFVETLPPGIDSSEPVAAVYLPSPIQGDPSIEAVLALSRGTGRISTERLDVFNEALYAIGHWFGLARRPKPGTIMFRIDLPNKSSSRLLLSDLSQAKKVVELSDQIRKQVQARKVIKLVKPQIFINPLVLSPSPKNQGDEMSISLQITNRGNGTLEYRVIPDCSCFILGPYTHSVEPGGTVIVPMYINTIDFVGKLEKSLFIYSNDPEMPIRRIPMKTVVRPAYRFVNLQEGSAVIIDENGGKYETLLIFETEIDVSRISVSGISAFASYEKWEGELDFPEIGEGKKLRKGIKISTLIAPNIATGRATMAIRIDTRHKIFKTIYHNVVVQRGIIALPMSIYLGEIEDKEIRAYTVLSRPDQPFKILSVESDSEFVKASFEPLGDGFSYKIIATYTGKAPFGRMNVKISIKTDDPKQPVITVSVDGIVS